MTTFPTASEIPASLHEYDQWVCWRTQARDGKQTKVPVNPHTGRYGSATDPDTWGSFEQARAYAVDGSASGLGFVFTDNDPFVGVDLDDARDPETETPTEWAESIIQNLDSYTEISPSGTGYHVLVEGNLPPGRNRRGDVELYETARFFTVTANQLDETPEEILRRTQALAGVYADHVAADHDDTDTDAGSDAGGDEDHKRVDTQESSSDGNETRSDSDSSGSTTLSDDELLSLARAASNSAKFERLWRGDTQGYDSHSEADMALACLLAFWTGGDTTRMDRLFRQSGLLRDKWDAVHYADGSTYGETTIERAVSVTTEYYSPNGEDSDDEDDQPQSNGEISHVSESSDDQGPIGDHPESAAEASLYSREQERIETIQTLEQRLRELEAENERLRDQRDAERAKRQALEENESVGGASQSGVLARLKRVFTRQSS
ncbi:phage NrS-1 polymerase family protein [Halorussus halophilus]|uniref:phage NrS-1 polymerase family protein n=1 Tax=Halorussus halophilus TaxID=2650975 RepID=UPI0013016074|nr:hypothetical protein [Halorussus halophilus]